MGQNSTTAQDCLPQNNVGLCEAMEDTGCSALYMAGCSPMTLITDFSFIIECFNYF